MASLFCFLFSFFFFVVLVSCSDDKETYIVYMNPSHKPQPHQTHAEWYQSHLESLSITDPGSHLLYSYSSSLHAFAARLSPRHVSLLRRSPSVVHLHPDPLLSLHTTRSPAFLGLLGPTGDATSSTISAVDAASHDVIVAVLDTGVWPESSSFNDAGMPPVPSRWRGECEAGVDFSPSLCNRKLVGARSFSKGFRAAATLANGFGNDDVSVVFAGDGKGDKPKEFASPRDRDGHGTHTASTAAGSAVRNASLLGYAAGTARGIATGARVAAYKVCWAAGCYGSDILAGMDAAISDGADVLSLSLGAGAAPYFRDTIAVGAFAAVARGVFVACSAGNSGPAPSSLANAAPWLTTVGAGTLDRDFPAYVTLLSGEKIAGVSLYAGKGMGRRMVPLIYGGDAAATMANGNSSSLCLAGALDPARVRGKIVLCDRGVSARVEKGAVVKAAGGAGMILANAAVNGEELVADAHLLPTVAVGKKDGDKIRNYVKRNSRNAKAALRFGGTVLGVKPSPVIAAFSSRGPNTITKEILKPDLVGPGVNILAGWSGSVGPTALAKDRRRTAFNIMSGTSMSCPHISGVAALLKAAHPEWSPSAIKSAMMTTAYTVDNTGSPLHDAAGSSFANPMSYGAGHVDPKKALSPGLIYDITTEDYIAFLCSLNYTLGHVQTIAKSANVTCNRRFSNPGDLNYPSFSVVFAKSKRVVKYARELTNVGQPGSVYTVKFEAPSSVSVVVKPTKLAFKKPGQKLRYTVTFLSNKVGNPADMAFGSITWSSKHHQVRSPVSCKWSML